MELQVTFVSTSHLCKLVKTSPPTSTNPFPLLPTTPTPSLTLLLLKQALVAVATAAAAATACSQFLFASSNLLHHMEKTSRSLAHGVLLLLLLYTELAYNLTHFSIIKNTLTMHTKSQ